MNLINLEKSPITREMLQIYAEASGDINPIHLDEKFAKAAGFPSVIAHGMISMAFLAEWIETNFPRPSYEISRMSTRFRKVTFPGDKLVCTGSVGERKGHLLTIRCQVTNQKAEVTTEGEAELRIRDLEK